MTKENRTNQRRHLSAVFVGIGVVLGLGTAGLIYSLAVPGDTSASEIVTPSAPPTSAVSLPDAGEVSPSPLPSNGTITTYGSTTTVTTGEIPKAVQDFSNTSTQVSITPKPTKITINTPKPSNGTPATTGSTTTAKECPDTRADNPVVWDACRAGYIAPAIEFAGVIACQAVDRAKGEWRITLKYEMSGGNYRTARWAGLANNAAGTSTLLLRGLPESALTESVSIGLDASIYVGSMNGLVGSIDAVDRYWDADVVLASICQ